MVAQLTLRSISDDTNWAIDCGIVQSMNDSINVTTSATPIVTYTAENAFVFDTGATESYSFTIIRKNPIIGEIIGGREVEKIIDGNSDDDIWDCTYEWTNSSWKRALTKFVNRWQAKTNGCKMTYIPVVRGDDERDIYQRSIIDANVYIKSLSFNYDVSSPEVLHVSLSLTLGSMCGPQKIEW